MGFLYAASGPLVRSSYRAAEVFLRSLAGKGPLEGEDGARAHDHRWVDGMLAERVDRARREAARVVAELGDGGGEGAPPAFHTDPGLVPAASLVRRA
jgi:lipoic acid synthetase